MISTTRQTLVHSPPGSSWASLIRHCVTEARPVVQLIFLMRFAVGALAASGGDLGEWEAWRTAVAALSVSCAVNAAYLLNGVMDVAEDRINGSRRPIARGALSRRTAVKAVSGLASAALLLAFLVPGLVWPVGLVLLLGYVYSAPPAAAKRWTVSSGVVVIGAGLACYAAGAMAVGRPTLSGPVLFCCVLALWMGCVGAVAKDLSDIRGDRAAGRHTIAVVHGEALARFVVALSALLLGAAGTVLALSDRTVLPGAVALAAGALWVTARCLRPLSSRPRAVYTAFMVVQYGANAGLLVGLLVG